MEEYKSLGELEDLLDVEYINNSDDLYRLIQHVHQNDETIYRGVITPKYKMFCSAQRFYYDKLFQIGLDYSSFVKRLYDLSNKIDNGYLCKLYSDVQKENYITYSDIYPEKVLIDYNPIWVYHTLQHITECSPFLDFSKDFYIALYFAAQGMSPLWSSSTSESELNNYIEIISIDEKRCFPDDKGSIINKMLNDNDPQKVKEKIESFDFTKYQSGEIEYICYGGNISIIKNKIFTLHYSFSNDNCIAQSGRLFLTSDQYDKPFEELWNESSNVSSKLKIYLIHKSLIDEIYKYLTIHLLGKVVVPIQRNYKEEILYLIKKQMDI